MEGNEEEPNTWRKIHACKFKNYCSIIFDWVFIVHSNGRQKQKCELGGWWCLCRQEKEHLGLWHLWDHSCWIFSPQLNLFKKTSPNRPFPSLNWFFLRYLITTIRKVTNVPTSENICVYVYMDIYLYISVYMYSMYIYVIYNT